MLQCRSGCSEDDSNIFPLFDIRLQFPQFISCNLITILTQAILASFFFASTVVSFEYLSFILMLLQLLSTIFLYSNFLIVSPVISSDWITVWHGGLLTHHMTVLNYLIACCGASAITSALYSCCTKIVPILRYYY